MSTSEELILISKNQFMKEQPYSSQVLNDPRVQHTGAQHSYRMRTNKNTDKESQEILDTREATNPTELSKLHADKILLQKSQHASASKICEDGKNS